MKKLLILIIISTLTLLQANDDNVTYRGATFNINLVFDPSCLSLLGTTDVVNKHVGVVGRLSYCDAYEGDAQNYLTESYSLGAGVALYSHSIYRDSFFLSAVGSLGHDHVKDIVVDITAQRFIAIATAGVGYQWQFQRGYIFTLGVYAGYSKPFAYEKSVDEDLNREVADANIKFTPTFLVGWRF